MSFINFTEPGKFYIEHNAEIRNSGEKIELLLNDNDFLQNQEK